METKLVVKMETEVSDSKKKGITEKPTEKLFNKSVNQNLQMLQMCPKLRVFGSKEIRIVKMRLVGLPKLSVTSNVVSLKRKDGFLRKRYPHKSTFANGVGEKLIEEI